MQECTQLSRQNRKQAKCRLVWNKGSKKGRKQNNKPSKNARREAKMIIRMLGENEARTMQQILKKQKRDEKFQQHFEPRTPEIKEAHCQDACN